MKKLEWFELFIDERIGVCALVLDGVVVFTYMVLRNIGAYFLFFGVTVFLSENGWCLNWTIDDIYC